MTFAGENLNHVYGTLFSALKFTVGDADISNRTQMNNSISMILNHCSSLPDIQMSLREVTALMYAGTLTNNRSDAVLTRKMTDILESNYYPNPTEIVSAMEKAFQLRSTNPPSDQAFDASENPDKPDITRFQGTVTTTACDKCKRCGKKHKVSD